MKFRDARQDDASHDLAELSLHRRAEYDLVLADLSKLRVCSRCGAYFRLARTLGNLQCCKASVDTGQVRDHMCLDSEVVASRTYYDLPAWCYDALEREGVLRVPPEQTMRILDDSGQRHTTVRIVRVASQLLSPRA